MDHQPPLLALLLGVQDRLTRAGLQRVVIGGSSSDDVITLHAYPVLDGDDGELLTGVQVRIRVPARASDIGGGLGELFRRQQVVKDELGSIEEEQLGAVTVAAAWRKTSVAQPNEPRPTVIDSYYFRHDED